MATGAVGQAAGSGRKRASPCWTSLPADLMQLIAARVLATGGFVDYVRFRAVCSHWRAAGPCPRGRGLVDPPFHPRRWMLFPEGFGKFPEDFDGHARFFNLSAGGAFIRAHVPLLRSDFLLDSPDGLLLECSYIDGAIHLLHPFTGDIVNLPSENSLVLELRDLGMELGCSWASLDIGLHFHLARKVCAAVNVTAARVITVMLALPQFERVAFASAGDMVWTISRWSVSQLDKALSFQGKLYVVNCQEGETHILQIDPPPPQCEGGDPLTLPPPRRIATCSSKEIHSPSLVELNSEIMLVGYNDSSFSHIVILRLADLGLGRGRTVPVRSIGDHVLFVGAQSLSVSSSWLPTIGANSIVCVRAGENYLSQYNLGTGTWSPTSVLAPGRQRPPRPCSLIHHIFTCCYRDFWRKGLMFFFDEEDAIFMGPEILLHH